MKKFNKSLNYYFDIQILKPISDKWRQNIYNTNLLSLYLRPAKLEAPKIYNSLTLYWGGNSAGAKSIQKLGWITG